MTIVNTQRAVRLNYLQNAATRVGLKLVVLGSVYAFERPNGTNAFYAKTIREAEAFASGTDFVHFGGLSPDDIPFE